MRLNAREIYHVFAPNLSINLLNDIYGGWDDKLIHAQDSSKIQSTLQTIKLLKPTQSGEDIDLSKLSLMVGAIIDLKEVTGEDAHKRTESEWNTIREYKNVFPKIKIIVFAGGAHNNETWMHDKLKESKYKFCIITPKKCQDTNPQSGFDPIDNAMKYYNADKYGIWGNRKAH